MTDRLDRRLEARKKGYERRRQAKQVRLDARRAQYETRKRADIGFGVGVSSIRKRAPQKSQKWVVKPYRETSEVLKPELEEKHPLLDVIDENQHLRIDIQLSNVSLPKDITIDEITDISFRHGVLEIRLRKRKKKLIKKEEKEITKAEEEITAKIKKKVLLLLKKRKIEEEAKEKFIL